MPVLDPVADRSALAAVLADGTTRLVACLCAAWCGTCREYRETLEQLAAKHPELCFVWVDIETHADWLDDHDIENFPTILVQDADQHARHARFFGPVLPASGVLERMLDARVLGDATVAAPALREHLLG
ncbi:thioredoxin family protein [Pandoraea nosoerga]|uniref:Thioredoxin n=1 Tax=Pandoraea nosoerga TaxID=2508296 RepID=A0A5E4UA85_9BURK|nr:MULTISPECIES: thioredoxin family protein [Pandoraea]MBN4667439.1 thioredoxin family protein [Pandoraea nosoerga]MBN4677414.1 thioredoxin family protein [Pandoraea nosoerga]MBN4682197.1 thioredoxin family protein [Pandoraea nosoerga]MBN4746534.1 thioredoxin family protein [Pandoraea nosoerga]VVD96701.1 Putative thioredoxin [Pandoraea nosoerga]